MYDYTSPIYDGSLPEDERGIYNGFPNVPDDAKANAWRIFTGSLSYPGPLPPPGTTPPAKVSDCVVVNPCDKNALKKFTKAGVGPDGKGACAFFYTSGGRYDSPSFHTPDEMPGGEYADMCKNVGKRQHLYDIDTGHYSVDGQLYYEDVGLRFFGPNYINNPYGPLGNYPALDEIFYLSFTTGVLKPQKTPDDPDVLPDDKINFSKNEFKINLTDPTFPSPPICKTNTNNRTFLGKKTSSWKYLKGLLYKDADGTVAAGCPEDDNDFTGGTAYLKGRNVDQETGMVTLVTGAKFGSQDSLSFAFKNVMMFVVLNGWLCDPNGDEDNFEGARCYDTNFNDRDSLSQTSIANK